MTAHITDVATGSGPRPAIAARNLSLGYGKSLTVQGVSLEVHDGEIVALLGPNGAGKTTTLLGLAGVLAPRAGGVEIRGETVTSPLNVRARRHGLSFITQDRCVFMGLTVLDNLRAGNVDPEEALEYFPELQPHLRRKVGLLSGGQQQILVVARAIARKPQVLIADELSLGLAPMVVDRIFEVLTKASRDDGLAILLVEQQINKALLMADRGAILRRGKLELMDTADALLNRMDEVQRLYL